MARSSKRSFTRGCDLRWRMTGSRTKIGMVLTAVWFGCVLGVAAVSIDGLASLKANEWGDLIAGVCAPPAFFWLIVGYFQQSEELGLQRKELALQRKEVTQLAEEAGRQAKALEEQLVFAKFNRDRVVQPMLRLAKSSHVGN